MLVETTLAEHVEGAIVDNPYFSSRHLRFETADGRVVLSGIVGTYFQKQMAQEIVRRIEGVREIDNCLEVCWRPRRVRTTACRLRNEVHSFRTANSALHARSPRLLWPVPHDRLGAGAIGGKAIVEATGAEHAHAGL